MDFFQWLEFIELITIITLAPNYSIFFCFSLINFLITFHYLFTMTEYPQCLSISIVVIPCFGIMNCVMWTTTRLQFKLSFFCPQHSMVTFCSKSLHYALVIYPHCRCKAWIENMMFGPTNIKNIFGFSFNKVCYLGHVRCVESNCDCLIHFKACNETT